ncbi:MAG: NAD(P) transhydrogenase subunit alpha [Cystobacterineae bacterium]|nr:NAD(P) transhydrogenase subunit alpha [Cystobacterineae bacterium]
MSLSIAVMKETQAGERRVALDPGTAERFSRLGAQVFVERQAGAESFFADAAYAGKAVVAEDFRPVLAKADVVFKVQPPTLAELNAMRDGATLLCIVQPHQRLELIKRMCQKNITCFALELVPRITRAQSMDVLSSQAAVAGYKAALIAANRASFFFPMLTTAAGTIRPAKVVVVGAGVAGLQAIATCKRLGAQVEAYDIRAAAKEQVESLGAKLIDTGVDASGEGGYARALTEEEKAKQSEVLSKHVAQAGVVITTAGLPGRPSPKIITKAMVEGMKPGALVVDMVAENGGNCELTKPGEEVLHKGVLVLGPLNLPSAISVQASETYAKNLLNFLSPFVKDGQMTLNFEDEVLAGSVLTHAGSVKHAPTLALIGG